MKKDNTNYTYLMMKRNLKEKLDYKLLNNFIYLYFMGLTNINELDPEFLFPFFYDSYYHELFTGNEFSSIIIDNIYETITTNINARFNGDKNPYLYAIVPSRHTKAFIRYECADYSPPCIIAQVNTGTKTEKKATVTLNDIPKEYLKRYFDFLRQQENSVKEGRWGLPALNSDGKKTYIVFNESSDGIRTKTTLLPDTEIDVDEFDSLAGGVVARRYKPYYIKSKAHPNSEKYGFTLDLNGKPVQRTVPTMNNRIIDNRWFLHQDYLGVNTIAYGHAIKPEEISSNKIQISDTEYATDWINKGLTDEQAFQLLMYDYKIHEKEVKRIIEAPRWNALPDMYKLALVEITYNGGGPRLWPKMCTAMGIPPVKKVKTYIWPKVVDFKLGPVDHEEVKAQLNRPQVSSRDADFKSIFF
jgi:hypothetical protein